MRRRFVLSFWGVGGVSVLAAEALFGCSVPMGGHAAAASAPFQPVQVPLPVNSDGLTATQQQSTYRELALKDRLSVSEGFRSDLLAAWGDRLGTSRFGFNNDHLGFAQQDATRASMTVNFEYISPVPWVQGFQEVVARALPFDHLVEALQPLDGVIDCTKLSAEDPRRAQIHAVADEAIGISASA